MSHNKSINRFGLTALGCTSQYVGPPFILRSLRKTPSQFRGHKIAMGRRKKKEKNKLRPGEWLSQVRWPCPGHFGGFVAGFFLQGNRTDLNQWLAHLFLCPS